MSHPPHRIRAFGYTAFFLLTSFARAQSPVRTTDSVSPQDGSGGSQAFTFVFSDSAGYQELISNFVPRILFTSGSGAPFCWLAVGPAGVSLAPDSQSSWTGVAYGSNAVVQNNECTIYGSGTTISGSGNTLTFNLSVTFHAAFAGMKTIYTNINSSGDYTPVGTYNVTATSPDFTISVSPASQSVQAGQSATYTVTATPTNGFNQDITLSLFGFPSGISGTLNPSVITGGSGTSTLTVTTAPASSTSTVQIALTATSPFVTHAPANYAQLSITGATPPPPPVRSTDSVSPQNGSGGSQAFTFVFSDSAGYQDLISGFGPRILFTSGSGAPFCWMSFGPSGVSLAPDGQSSWTGVAYGSNAVVQNNECTIYGSGTTISGSGNTLTVNLLVTFHAAFAGMKTIYTNVNSSGDYVGVGTYNVTATSPDFTLSVSPASQSVQAGQSATYTVTATPTNGFNQDITLSTYLLPSGVSGTLNPSVITGGSGTSTLTITTAPSSSTSTVQIALTATSPFVTHLPANYAQLSITGASPPPPPVRSTDSVSPQHGSGGSQAFTFVFSDSAGYQDLISGFSPHILFTSGSGAPFCWMSFGPSGVSLAPDGLTSWTGVAYGSNAVVQNNECTIYGSGTTISGSGNTLTVNLLVTFHAAFAGMKTIYTNVNSSGNYIGVGTYNVTATSPDFTLSVSPASQSVQAGQSATYTVTATPTNGFNQDITLSTYLLPSGVSGTLNPSVITGGSGTSTLTITTAPGSSTSTVQIALTATSPFVTHAPANYAQLSITGASPPPPPTVSTDSVSPQNGSGSSQVFTLQFSDSNGYRDLLGGNYHVLVNATADGTNSCWIQLLSTGLSLAPDDPNGTWSFVPYGTSTTAQNSQCMVNGVGTSISGSGNTLTLSLSLTFTAAYAGSRNVYTDVNSSSPNYMAVTSYTVQ